MVHVEEIGLCFRIFSPLRGATSVPGLLVQVYEDVPTSPHLGQVLPTFSDPTFDLHTLEVSPEPGFREHGAPMGMHDFQPNWKFDF